jgi:F0F1-type ATP synthase membrane subunit c/vacuolar-type H+-ATPase subunit K
MADYGSQNPSLSGQLMTLRIIWFALLLGPLAFLGMVIFVVLPGRAGTNMVHPQPQLVLVNGIMLVTMIPIGYVIRRFVFRAGRVDWGIAPAAFARGNIIFWAMCEGVAFSGLVFATINRSLWPTIVFVVIALGLQALTVPMRSSLSTEGER